MVLIWSFVKGDRKSLKGSKDLVKIQIEIPLVEKANG